MKEPVELEPMKKIDEIRRFYNKELRLPKSSMRALPKCSEYCRFDQEKIRVWNRRNGLQPFHQ